MSGGGTDYNFDAPGSASNQLAAIIRQQYANYQSMFVPEENKAIAYATNPNTVPEAGMQAMQVAGNSFNSQQQGQAMQLKTSGINLTPQQSAQLARRDQIAKTVATDDSANRAGISAYDNVSSILSGAPSVTGILPPGAGSGGAAQPG